MSEMVSREHIIGYLLCGSCGSLLAHGIIFGGIALGIAGLLIATDTKRRIPVAAIAEAEKA